MAGRIVGVFVSWGVLLAGAIGVGMNPHHAEVLAACGAGLSLMVWGAAVAREQRRMAEIMAETQEPAEQEGRASG